MTTTAAAYDAAPLGAMFSTDFGESAYEVSDIEGGVPSFLRGTYYVNGPGAFGQGAQRCRSWLDGDGMVCALRFSDSVSFVNRFVQTAKRTTETEAGRPVFRTFATSFLGDRLRRGIVTESPANVSVCTFNGGLLAFGEQSLPYALDPDTLETRGVYDFGGALNEVSPFSAHPKHDPVTGELLNFGISFSPRDPRLNYYRFSARGELLRRASAPLDAPYSVHDFAASPRFAVFHLGPYLLDVVSVLRDGLATVDALRWLPERGSRLLIVARDDGQELARPEVAPYYSLHTIRAFEQQDMFCVDLIEYERPLYTEYQPLPRLFDDVPAGWPVRYVFDTRTWRLTARLPLPYRSAPDFPCVDPGAQARDEVWMLGISRAGRRGPKFFDRLVRASWRSGSPVDVYTPPGGRYLGGEPALVPDPDDPGTAAVICHEFDPRIAASWFLIFDAYDLSRGPQARLAREGLIPAGFHAAFAPRDHGDAR